MTVVSAGDRDAMREALAEARAALETGDVPVGAVVLDEGGRIIGRGRNARERESDPTAHAEVVALREAGRASGDWQLSGCTLVVTLEPCVLCTGAILAARIDRVVFGAWEEKAGAAGSVLDLLRERRLPYRVREVIAGVDAEESARILRDFFAERRP
ncbi:MAG: nucleoside deaminase [Microcella sp.]|uniref:nucleoside deaminase n=1 Tax=Microcella sp. TaxID=1913979 RepID=UPI003316106F